MWANGSGVFRPNTCAGWPDFRPLEEREGFLGRLERLPGGGYRAWRWEARAGRYANAGEADDHLGALARLA